jgi:hypothetical protein
LTVPQPFFGSFKAQFNGTMQHGERRLIYAGKPIEPEGQMMLCIAGLSIQKSVR